MQRKPKRKGLKIVVRSHRLNDDQKSDLEIMVEWGYSHAAIAESLFGSANEHNVRRVNGFCTRMGISVKPYRNAQSDIGRFNLSRILHGYKLKIHTA